MNSGTHASVMGNRKNRAVVETVAQIVFTICAFFAVLAVVSITLYMIISGTPAIMKVGLGEILFGTEWMPTAADPKFGILWVILTSIVGTTLAILLGVPIGVLTAVFLAEVAPRPLAAIVKPAVELLAGIPSVIYGLLGIYLLNPLMYKLERLIFQGSTTHQFTGGANLLSAVIVLAIMILPTVMRTTQESLKTVPQSYREGALGLGAGKWHMIRTVVLPGAVDGIVTGCILAVGRIVGESAALLYTAGFGLVLNNFVTALESSSATLTVALYVYASERGETDIAFAIATILMLLTLVINLSANLVGRKLKKN